MRRYSACVAGLCSCLLTFEKSEEINYARCLVLQHVELLKYIDKLDMKGIDYGKSIKGKRKSGVV